ncbi:MAG: O-methyltransferase [Bacteroidales bacterium]|jgi:predicted O-methyltransferase YrrM|nr:O-methyltransferase [Bacteroidales bacterium]
MIDSKIEAYIDAHSTKVDEVLDEIYRQTHLTQMYPRMISGPLQGKFLEMICAMLQPKKVLEIGTFTAYSTISMARGLSGEGHIITFENNEELEDIIHDNLNKAGVAQQVQLIIGDAIALIPQLADKFDLVFIDADKINYPRYFELVLEKLNPGGFILADNVLWSGKVAYPAITDEETRAIRQFNAMARDNKQTEQIILPLRDGISMIRKISGD